MRNFIKISGISVAIIILLVNKGWSDFGAIVNKQVNIEKEQKISAKIDGENKIIEGFLKATPNSEKEGINIIDIIWTVILDKKARLNVNGLTSNFEIDKSMITRGTSVLIKGTLPNDLKFKSEEEKKDDKNNRSLPSNSGSSGGSTNISNSPSNPVDTPSVAMERPDFITTYDGCNQLYNQNEETIMAFQQTYYVDNDGVKKIVDACHKVKEFPAEKQECTIYHNFQQGMSYKRYQPYFTEDNKTYGAGGCIPFEQYIHKIDYSVCEAKAIGDRYIKQGQWYYQEQNGDKVYISACILDPEGKEDFLQIQFEGCKVIHDNEKGQSMHEGKYYWVRDDNTKEYLGECIETNNSYFSHQFLWNDNNQWQHNNDDKYSQRILTRFIAITSENNRKIVINDKEVEPIKHLHSVVQEGWRYHDDLKRGSPEGHDSKWMRTVVKYGNQQFYTGKDYEEGWYKHNKLWSETQYSERCGGKLNPKSRFYYKDHIGRNDGSEYLTDKYDTGCT